MHGERETCSLICLQRLDYACAARPKRRGGVPELTRARVRTRGAPSNSTMSVLQYGCSFSHARHRRLKTRMEGSASPDSASMLTTIAGTGIACLHDAQRTPRYDCFSSCVISNLALGFRLGYFEEPEYYTPAPHVSRGQKPAAPMRFIRS